MTQEKVDLADNEALLYAKIFESIKSKLSPSMENRGTSKASDDRFCTWKDCQSSGMVSQKHVYGCQ